MNLPNFSNLDKHAVRAATGWMELSKYDEALSELDNISNESKQTSEILNLKWQILAKREDWAGALEIAKDFVKFHPGLPTGWIHQSYSLHELKRTVEARDYLLNASELFPLNSHIAYNIACYTCKLEKDDEALQWIQEAISMKEKSTIIAMALKDKDLERIHPQIARLA